MALCAARLYVAVIFVSPGGVVSTVVPDSAHKLFIGGLPNYLNDDQVGISVFPQFYFHTRAETQQTGSSNLRIEASLNVPEAAVL